MEVRTTNIGSFYMDAYTENTAYVVPGDEIGYWAENM